MAAALLLDIQAVVATPAIILLQETLAVLETILLVPLVTIRNHPQATEGCKRRRAHMAYDRCDLRLLVYPSIANSRSCNAQHILSVTVTQHWPSVICGFLVSWLNRPLLSLAPITLYLAYLLTFDPVLHLFSVSLDIESILPFFLCSSVASPPHTQYIVAIEPPVSRKLTTGALRTCACAMLALRPQMDSTPLSGLQF